MSVKYEGSHRDGIQPPAARGNDCYHLDYHPEDRNVFTESRGNTERMSVEALMAYVLTANVEADAGVVIGTK